jgi:hypothetical protein
VRTFDAAAAFVCSAGSGLGGKQVKLVDDTRKFQLPASFFVFVSTCPLAPASVAAQLSLRPVCGSRLCKCQPVTVLLR